MKKLLIIGGGVGFYKYPYYLKESSDIWCSASIYPNCKEATRVFEVHKDWCLGTWKALREGKLAQDFVEIEGRTYTSTFDYMISEAIDGEFKEIRLVGVSLSTPAEAPQKLGLEYMLGYCRALGIVVVR